MPNRNATGPEGKGARTGRGMGNCDGNDTNSRPMDGRGAGRGPGLGLGRKLGFGRRTNQK